MPETGGKIPFLFRKARGEVWGGTAARNPQVRSHMGGKEDVASGSQPFRASYLTLLRGR